MIDFSSQQGKMKELERCLCNDLRGIELEECADLFGFIVKQRGDRYPLFTVYVAPNGYSSYEAINDIHKGHSIVDEKPLALNAPLFTCVAKIKEQHRQYSPALYNGILERDEGYRAGYYD